MFRLNIFKEGYSSNNSDRFKDISYIVCTLSKYQPVPVMKNFADP